MRSLRLWLTLALVPWLAGFSCPAIYSDEPLGKPAVLDPQKLNGTWIGAGGYVYELRVLDEQKGKLLAWGSEDGRHLPQCDPPQEAKRVCSENPQACLVRSFQGREGNYYFERAYVAVERDAKEGGFKTEWAVLGDGETLIIMYLPVEEEKLNKRLTALVQTGALSGRIEPSGRVVLGQLTAEHYRLILSEEGGVFDWMYPIPYVKLPDEMDPCKKGKP